MSRETPASAALPISAPPRLRVSRFDARGKETGVGHKPLRIDVRQIFHGAHIAFAGVDADNQERRD